MGVVNDQHLKFWHQLIKDDPGPLKLLLPSILFYIVDYGVFIFNLVTHISNGAWLGLGLTLLFHFFSMYWISGFYKSHENAIDEQNKSFELRNKFWTRFRLFSQLLGITHIFRVVSNWKDLHDRHSMVRGQRILRRDIERSEIENMVCNKRREVVKSYFDIMHVYFKTLPQCIFQIYIALDVQLPLRFCTVTDVSRAITIAWSIIAASKAATSYEYTLLEYLKVMQFQDYFIYNHSINLILPKTSTKIFTSLWNTLTISARLYCIAYLLTFGGLWATVLIFSLFIAMMIWFKMIVNLRLPYENPPVGITTSYSDITDRVVNVFCFHMIRRTWSNVIVYQLIFITIFSLVTVFGLFQTDCTKTWLALTIHTILNSHETANNSSTFSDFFSNQTTLICLLGISIATSIPYMLLLQYQELNTFEFPIQISYKSWKSFLNQDWDTKGISFAKTVVLLGTIKHDVLETFNYNLSSNNEDLSGIISTVVNEADLLREVNFNFDRNPCGTELQILYEYIKMCKDGSDTEAIISHFCEHFDIYMDQMTSNRIAQTLTVLQRDNSITCSSLKF